MQSTKTQLISAIQEHFATQPIPLNLSEGEVEIHALRYFANSLTAQSLQAATRPNISQQTPSTITNQRGEARKRRYQDFNNALITKLRARGFTCRRKSLDRHYYELSAGHGVYANILYSCSFNRGGKARVELYLGADGRYNKRLFDYLYSDCADIDAEFGEDLYWQRLDHRKASRIATPQCDGQIDDNEHALSALQDWMVDKLEKLDRVLGPRLEKFDSARA